MAELLCSPGDRIEEELRDRTSSDDTAGEEAAAKLLGGFHDVNGPWTVSDMEEAHT